MSLVLNRHVEINGPSPVGARLPQRFTMLDADVVAIQDFIERNCRP